MSLTDTEIESAAQLLCRAHEGHWQLSMSELNSVAPQSLEDAYAIQEAVASKRWLSQGLRTNTWKTGAPSAEAEPYAAPIPPQVIESSPAVLDPRNYHLIGIEAELAFRFASDLPKRAQPYSDDEVTAAIEGVYVTIEVVDTRLGDWQQAGKWWQLADNQITGGLVVGSGIANWQAIDPSQQSVELYIDGARHLVRQGSHPMGDPRPLLGWIANHCAERREGLKAGDVVTTGSWTGLLFVEAGAEIRAVFPGIGEAAVSFPQ